MTLLVFWVLSAHAEPPDLTQPEGLAALSARQLVDLSSIGSATMIVRFDGAGTTSILGASGEKALLASIAKTKPGAKKNETLRSSEAIRLMETVGFEVRMTFDAQRGLVITVPAVHWGELQDFEHLPDDRTACYRAFKILRDGSASIWADLHLSGTAWSSPARQYLSAVEVPSGVDVSVSDESGPLVVQLENETFLPVSLRRGDPRVALRLRYEPYGQRKLLTHLQVVSSYVLLAQEDITFAEVGGFPWPETIVSREGRDVLTARFSDVVLREADAPENAMTAARPPLPPPAPIDPGDPRSWPAAIDAIDTHFYSWFPAEALHFTISRTCEPNTWLSPEALREYIKKRPGPTPPEDRIPAEVVRLSNQVTYDVDVVLKPFRLRVVAVHLGELEGAFDAAVVETLRQRAENGIFSQVFGKPNHMMLRTGGFFAATEAVTQVDRDPRGMLLTDATAEGTHQVLVDDETGLPSLTLWPSGGLCGYRFDPGPTGAMLLTTYTGVSREGTLDQWITYTYGDVAGVTVPTTAYGRDATYTFTNWRIDDITAPFVANSDASSALP